MAASSAVVANRALAHLGVDGGITTLSSDATAPGAACRQCYDAAVIETLKGAPWRAAAKVASLTLVETLTQSRDEEWLYSYRLPEDCLAPRRLRFYGNGNPNPDQEVPFELFADAVSTTYSAATTYTAGQYAQSVGIWYRALRETINDTPASSALDWVAVTRPPKLLHCSITSAVLEYTMALTDPTRWDEDLEAAIVARLAYEVAPRVTINGSAVDLRGQVAQTYNALLSKAIESDAAARKRGSPPRSTWQTARTR